MVIHSLLLLFTLLGGDLDGDGCDDVALEAGRVGVSVHSGRTGEVLARWDAPGRERRREVGSVEVSLVRGADAELEVLYVDAHRGVARWFTPAGMFLRHLPGRRPRAVKEQKHPLVHARTSDGGAVFVRGGLVMPVGTEHPDGVEIGRIEAFGLLDDVDGDGVREFVVGRPDARDGAGQAEVLSGRDGAVLFAFDHRVGGAFGTSVAAVGDVDGDGTTDVAVGAPYGGFGIRGSDTAADGAVVVFSGADGAVLHELTARSTFDLFTRFGAGIVALGDVDGDERGDFAVAARKHDCAPHESQTGSVGVYSGRTGALRFELFGPPAFGYFGRGLRSPGDANGDGVRDLLVRGIGLRALVSGRDGALLWLLEEGADGRLERADGWTVRAVDGRDGPARRLHRAR